MSYYTCFVPMCRRTSTNSPSKVFVTVPRGERRLSWFAAVGISEDTTLSLKSHMSCCEDHFNLAEDIANFEWYKYTQSLGLPGRMQLKPDAIPRLVQVVLEEPKKKKRKIKKKKENEEVESSDVKPKENEEVVHIKVENIDVEEDVPQEGANSDVLEETEVDPFSEVANNDFMRPVKNVVSNKDEEDTHFEIADNDFTCQVKNCCSKSPALAFSKVWTLECIPTPTLEVSKKRKQPFLTS